MHAVSCAEGISNIEQGVMKAEGIRKKRKKGEEVGRRRGRRKTRLEGEPALLLLHSKFLARNSIFLRFNLPLREQRR
jgi:hypothetical protein